MRPSRLALLAVATTLTLTSHSAGAASAPILTDPAGDAVALGPGYDVVSATVTTTGKTTKVGWRRKSGAFMPARKH